MGILATAAGFAPVSPELALAAALGGLLAIAARRAPAIAGLAVLVATAAVPVYYGRYVVGTVALTPSVAGCLVLLPAALARARDIRVTALDVAVAAYVACRCTSYLLNSGTYGAVAGPLLGVALPYVTFRLLDTDGRIVRHVPPVVVATASGLSLVALAERAGTPNPFFTLVTPGYQGEVLARSSERLGAVRAEASFGDPIAFGMFLAVALVLAVHLALESPAATRRWAALGASAVVLSGLAATQSRGPLGAGAVGVAVLLITSLRRTDVLRVAALAGAAAAAVAVTPVLTIVQALVLRSSGETREARSAEYRLQILAVVRQPEQFSLLGERNLAGDEGVTAALSQRVGLKSLDSELASVYLNAGALALLALVAVLALLVALVVRARLPRSAHALAVALVAMLINLLTVALLTQTSDLTWAWAGLIASAAAQSRPTAARGTTT